nr:MAG TPA: hypothetical protein [Caudoviricetes sp.]DAR72249.1 MAG TPA: hypothetical protein [Caudoviricetes sp.]
MQINHIRLTRATADTTEVKLSYLLHFILPP